MPNLKLFALLSTLKPKEVATFHKYLEYLHGKEEIALKVFAYLSRFGPPFELDKRLDLALAHQEIFGEDIAINNNRKRLLNALSDLHLWLKDFLISEKVRQDPFKSQLVWLEILKERKELKAEFSRQATNYFEETKRTAQHDSEGSLKHLLACYFYSHHLLQFNPLLHKKALEQILSAMETCGKTNLLTISCQVASLRKIQSLEPVPTDSLPMGKMPKSLAIEHPVLLEVYQEIYQLIHTQEETRYHQIKKMLEAHVGAISPQELHGILKYLYNYAAIQIRMGKEAVFGPALHQLNLFGLQHGFFASKGGISPGGFLNIVNVAATQHDFDWAASFIQEHGPLLPAEHRTDLIKLANALILFEQQRFHEVLDLAATIELEEIYLVIRLRTLVLRCYFEIREDQNTLLEACASFLDWLKRKPKTDAINATIEFIRVFKMLVVEKTEKQTLMNLLESNLHLYFRQWLLSKMEGYKGRFVSRRQGKN